MGEAQSCLRPGCSRSLAAPPLGSTNQDAEKPKDRTPHLDARGSMSFDPHPIDQLAQSVCSEKGGTPVAARPLPRPLPQLENREKQLKPTNPTSIHPQLSKLSLAPLLFGIPPCGG